MTTFYKRCAQVLIDLALKAALPKQKEWACAMKAELEHLPDRSALPFALGCVATLAKERVSSDAFILLFARRLLLLSEAMWSVGHIWLAEQLSSSGDETPAMLSYVAAAFIAAGTALVFARGLSMGAKLIVPVLLAAVVVGMAGPELLPASPHNRFYQAMALEYTGLLSVALLIAAGLPYWVSIRKRDSL